MTLTKIEFDTPENFPIQQKNRMDEARDAIIQRLARELPTDINLEKFLQAVVSQIGQMMEVDRCDLIQMSETNELRISHEWRRNDKVPSSVGTAIPVDAEKLAEKLKLTEPIRVNDTSKIKDKNVKFLARVLETRSLLVVPIKLNGNILGLIGLHDTNQPREWHDDEVSFLESVAQQLAIGYEYTNLYVNQEQETKRTNSLLEIANTLNSHSDFKEVSSRVLERAVNLIGADYGALGVLDDTGDKISLAAFKTAPEVKPATLLKWIDSYGKSLDLAPFPKIGELLKEGKTLKVIDKELPFLIRQIFNRKLGGKSALVVPVRIGGQAYGLLGFVWGKERESLFEDNEVKLAEGIGDQIGTALERDQLSAEVMRLKNQLNERHQSQIIGQSPEIRRAIKLALNVADTNTTVLIQGESGTGKELIADLIHYNSGRGNKPYVKINCGAIPETLLESELFGHEKGAFTDAHSRRVGRFEEAHGGTLFLDEIGEMSPSAQVKLLRVLQDGKFTRIGGKDTVKTDVRVVAATNIDLEKAIKEGSFRRDLYYRLSAFPINIPSLRERAEDIHLLVFHFLELYKEKTGRFVSGISKDALRALVNYEWFGNVRELENAVERAVIIAAGRQIELGDLPETIGRKASELGAEVKQERLKAASEGRSAVIEIEVPSALDEVERKIIEATLDYTDGDKSQASRLLNIGRKTLYRKLEQYGESEI